MLSPGIDNSYYRSKRGVGLGNQGERAFFPFAVSYLPLMKNYFLSSRNTFMLAFYFPRENEIQYIH